METGLNYEDLISEIEEHLYPATATSVDEDYDMKPIIRNLQETVDHMKAKYPGVYRQVEIDLRSNYNPDMFHSESRLNQSFNNTDPESILFCSQSTCNINSCDHFKKLRNLLVKGEIRTNDESNKVQTELENPDSWTDFDPHNFEQMKCFCKCNAANNADQEDPSRPDQVPAIPVKSIHPLSEPPNQSSPPKILQETIRSLEQRNAESEEKIGNLEGIIRGLERTIQDLKGTNKRLEEYSCNPKQVALFQTDVSCTKSGDSEEYSSKSNCTILPATIKEDNQLSGNRSSKRCSTSPDILQHKKKKKAEETSEAHCSKILIPVKGFSSQSVPTTQRKQAAVRLSKPERASVISAVISTIRSVPNWGKRVKEEIMLDTVLELLKKSNPDFPIGKIKHFRWTLNNMIRAHLKKTSSNQKLDDVKLDQVKYINVLLQIQSNLKK